MFPIVVFEYYNNLSLTLFNGLYVFAPSNYYQTCKASTLETVENFHFRCDLIVASHQFAVSCLRHQFLCLYSCMSVYLSSL